MIKCSGCNSPQKPELQKVFTFKIGLVEILINSDVSVLMSEI